MTTSAPSIATTVDTARPSEKPSTPNLRDGDVYVIDHQGDVILRIQHESATVPTQAQKFRVSSECLKTSSNYFRTLLQGQFGESKQITQMHRVLSGAYGSAERAPTEKLPVLRIEDLGHISAVKSIVPLCTDFLRVIHGLDIAIPPPVANLANITIVADRFDAIDVLKAYVHRKKVIRAIEGRGGSKSDSVLNEERIRQRLFLGIMLDHAGWVNKYSARLIIKGLVRNESDKEITQWWDLPHRVEDELTYRRDCILKTISSLQTYFVKQYLSRDRQCKLGYDSSPQCDSFQLGEMIRFFTRIGTIQLSGTVVDDVEGPEPYSGDIFDLLDTLRQVPEYQIDRNHMHCGIRTRLIPLLDFVVQCLQQVGICNECWSKNRVAHEWMNAKAPLMWRRHSFRNRGLSHEEQHANIREMFTASERDWGTLGSFHWELDKLKLAS